MKVLQTDNFGNQKEVEIKPVAESYKQKKLEEFEKIWWEHLDTYNSRKEKVIKQFISSLIDETEKQAYQKGLDDFYSGEIKNREVATA